VNRKKPPLLKFSHKHLSVREKGKWRETKSAADEELKIMKQMSSPAKVNSIGSENGSHMKAKIVEKDEYDSEDGDIKTELPSPSKADKNKKLTIQDFELVTLVGVGNFGKVYKAKNLAKDGRLCALKVVSKESVAAMK